MAAAAAPIFLRRMTEHELRQWVDANPASVNDLNEVGLTPLYAAVFYKKSLPLVVL